jgi:hypothetical protein
VDQDPNLELGGENGLAVAGPNLTNNDGEQCAIRQSWPIVHLDRVLGAASRRRDGYLAGGDPATGWSNNAVQNWEQYGFLKLKAKLVINPGGYEALTKPEVYKVFS